MWNLLARLGALQLLGGVCSSATHSFDWNVAEPIPDSFLFNNSISQSCPVKPGKTYLIRLRNIATFVGQYFWIENHTVRIVEINGVYVDETEAESLYLSVVQRYSILVTMKNSSEKNYGTVMVADSSLLDTTPSDLSLNQTNWLEYNAETPNTRGQNLGCIHSISLETAIPIRERGFRCNFTT